MYFVLKSEQFNFSKILCHNIINNVYLLILTSRYYTNSIYSEVYKSDQRSLFATDTM